MLDTTRGHAWPLLHRSLRPGAAADSLAAATMTLVLAGGRGSRLHQLTDGCAKPALPFAGQLKVIDFALSNCINSGLRRIAVLTQYKAQSLIRHLTRGWGFLDAGLGEYVDVVPAQQRIDACWYKGTADAVFQNLDMLRDAAPEYVLVLAGDHVYKMDYGVMLAEHAASGADVTVACLEVPLAEAPAFGVVRVDDHARVIGFEEKPARPRPVPGRPDRALASMGIYVFSADILYDELARDAQADGSGHDFGGDILPRALAGGRVHAHDFHASCVRGPGEPAYWRDVGTLDAYWQAHMDLTRECPGLDLYDDAWPLRTLPQTLPPARFVYDDDGRRGTAADSLVAGGCIVSGASVRRSVLSSKVRIGPGSVVEDALLLPGAVLGRNVVLRRAIVDQGCVLPDGLKAGLNPAEDRARFRVTDDGVTLITAPMLARVAPGPG